MNFTKSSLENSLETLRAKRDRHKRCKKQGSVATNDSIPHEVSVLVEDRQISEPKQSSTRQPEILEVQKSNFSKNEPMVHDECLSPGSKMRSSVQNRMIDVSELVNNFSTFGGNHPRTSSKSYKTSRQVQKQVNHTDSVFHR